jgi:tetratricopeptide (TPR) repeat protein
VVTNLGRIPLSIEKRIILYLANYIDLRDSYEGNAAITQQGIAEAIGIHYQHVPRSLKTLLKDELVYERKTHVIGFQRRKKIYFLTSNGIKYSNEIIKWFENKKILIKNYDNEIREIKFYQLKDKLNFKLNPLEAYKYSLASKNNIIDLNQILSDRKQSGLTFNINLKPIPSIPTPKKQYYFSPNIPLIETFIGRKDELKTIQNLLDSDTKIILIHGIAGIGKSTLVSKVVENYKIKTNIYWYQFEPWSSIKNVLKSLSGFLEQMGGKKLHSYFNSHDDFDLGEVIEILSKELDNLDAILVFDDFHKCDKHTLDLFFSFKRLCEKIALPKIIIISRIKQRFYDQRDVSIKKLIAEIHVTGLDFKESRKLLKINEINDHQFKTMYNIVKGHPVALRLIDSIDSIRHQSDFRSFIHEQVFNELNNDEKKILNVACVFRYPVESDALFPKEDHANYETLSDLKQKFLIMKTPLDTYIMQELLIEIYYKRLTPEQKIFYHNHAANYYENKKNDIDVMEQIYHLIQAHKFKDSAKLIIEFGDRLISQGYLEFFNLLEVFTIQNLPVELYKEILVQKGDASIKRGNWDRAMRHYEESLELMEKVTDSENAAEVYRKLGNIYRQKGDWEKTIKLHLESLKIFKEKKNKKEMAKIYNDLGLVYRQMGDYDKSLEMYKKGLKIFKEINEKIGISIVSLNLGRMYELKGRFKNALKNYKKGIQFSEENKYTQGMAFGHKFLGMLNSSIGKIDQTIIHLHKSLNYFKKLKNDENIIQIYIQLGEINYKKKDYDQSIEMLKKGINNLENRLFKNKYQKNIGYSNRLNFTISNSYFINEDDFKNIPEFNYFQMTLAQLYEKVGNIYREQFNFDNALNYHKKYLDIATELDDNLEIAKACINIGIDQRKRQAYNQALDSYKCALTKLTAINDKIGIITVYRNIGKIYDLKNDLKNAFENYNISVNLSKDIQYDIGIAKGYKEIAKIYFKLGEKRRGNIYLEKAWRLMENISNSKNSILENHK